MEVLLLTLVSIGVLLFFLLKKDSSPSSRSSPTFSLKDAGYNFYETYEVTGVHTPQNKNFIIQYVSEQDPVTLKPEPTNPYNNEAIAIYHENYNIGYIADHDLDEVHEIIKKDYLAGIKTKILSGTWLKLSINIYYKEELN